MQPHSEAQRLEHLWAGGFGDQYIERNRDAAEGRGPQWDDILSRWPAQRVLEIGCNIGGNLRHIANRTAAWGIDINPEAIRVLTASVPVAGAGVASARSLPFRDGWFDLTFTAGVLIHQPAETLPLVLAEVVRCSSRWVLAAEYDSGSQEEEVVPYHGEEKALFRRDYGRMYSDLFSELRLVKSWFNDEATWDRTTFWMFEKARD